MVEGKVCIDGQIVDSGEARVPVLDRGFLYGDSVFEVYRTYDGVPFAERPHLERLARSAERLMIPMPLSLEALADEVHQTIAAAGAGDWYVRVVVTRGTGPLTYDPTTATSPLRVIIVAPLRPYPESMYREGAAVVTLEASRPTDDARAAGAKASNYLANLLAVHEAKERGAQEAIVVGRDGQLLEGASSNLFVVKGGVVRTPPPQPGILIGITRATVLATCERLDLTLHEAEIYPNDLYGADEAFITSSIREVMPVVRADDRTIGDGRPGPVTERLRKGYLEAVREQIQAGV